MKNLVLIKFGENVKKHRLNKKLSQEDLAHKSGLHRTYIGMIERAEKNLTLINMKKIADALEINIQVLFEGI